MVDPESVLTCQCPDTGRVVRSTIRTDKTTLAKLGQLKISVGCPNCEGPHKITCSEASLIHSVPAEIAPALPAVSDDAELIGLERHVGCAEGHGVVLNLPDVAAGADRLYASTHFAQIGHGKVVPALPQATKGSLRGGSLRQGQRG
jgi:hypothetical protein